MGRILQQRIGGLSMASDGWTNRISGRGHAWVEDRHDGQKRKKRGWTWTRARSGWMDVDRSRLSMDNAGHAKFLEFRFVIRIVAVWASGMMLRRDAAVTPLHHTSGIAKVVGSLRIVNKTLFCFETVLPLGLTN